MSRLFVAIAALLLTTAPSIAAEPMITGQIQSIDAILKKFDTTVDSFLSPELSKVMKDSVRTKLNLNAIPGLDPKRPIAFYGSIAEDPLASRFVFMFPVTDEKAFIQLLGTLKLDVKPGKEGVYSITVPGIPLPNFMKFVDGYAWISVLSALPLENGKRLALKDVLRDDKSAVVLSIKPTLLPQSYRELIETIVAQAGNDIESQADGLPQMKKAGIATNVVLTRFTNMLLSETKEITFRLDLDPASGMVTTETEIEPIAKSRFAASVAEFPATTNTFASLATPDSLGSVRFRLPLVNQEIRDLLTNLLQVGEVLIKMSEGFAFEEMSIEMLKALGRTAKTGDIDFAGVMRGPNANQQFSLVGVLTLQDTSTIEKVWKKTLGTADPSVQKLFKLGASKIGDVEVHSAIPPKKLSPENVKLLGDGPVYFAFAPNAVLIGIGPDAVTIMGEALNAKKGPSPILDGQLSWKRVIQMLGVDQQDIPLFRDLTPQQFNGIQMLGVDQPDIPKGTKESFNPKLDRLSMLQFDMKTGKTLKIKAGVSAFTVFMLLTGTKQTFPAQ